MKLNQTQKEKVSRFLDDKMLSETIYGIMLESFLKTRKGDVQVLAASRLSIDYLQDAWKDLLKYKNETQEESSKVSNYV
jgi:hypothetical protein